MEQMRIFFAEQKASNEETILNIKKFYDDLLEKEKARLERIKSYQQQSTAPV